MIKCDLAYIWLFYRRVIALKWSPKHIFHYIKTHKFTVLLRASLFCLCVSLVFTILFGLLERDGVFKGDGNSAATPKPAATATPGPTPDKKTENYISVNLGSEPLYLNSITAEDSVTKTILRHMLEGLVRLDAEGKVIPAVATGWTPSEDGLTWTFTLRENSFWQDGTRVVAGDFKAAIDLHLDAANKSPYRGQMEALFAAVETPDNNTVIFTLKQANANFPALLAETQFMPIQKALYEKNPTAYGFDPAGLCYNGPWYVALWSHNQRIVMVQNETYWNAANIVLEQLIFISSGTEASKYANFEAGNYDVVFLSALEAERYRNGGYALVNYPDGAVVALEFNKNDALLQSESLRQALSLSIDRAAFVTDTLKTGATAVKGYDIATDLPAAKQALDSFLAKDKDALKNGLVLTVDESEDSVLYATALAQQWSKNLGIQVNVEPLSYAERIAKIQKGTMQISIAVSTADAASLEAPLYYRHTLYATNGRIQNVISAAGRDFDLYYATPKNKSQSPA